MDGQVDLSAYRNQTVELLIHDDSRAERRHSLRLGGLVELPFRGPARASRRRRFI